MIEIRWKTLEDIATHLGELVKIGKQIVLLTTPEVPHVIEFHEVLEDGTTRRTKKMAIRADRKGKAILTIKDAMGNFATVDGAPQWEIDNADLGTLEVAEDGMTAEFTPAGHVGAAIVTVTVDADRGEGVRHLTFQGAVVVISGDAAEGFFEFVEVEEAAPEEPVEEPGEETPEEPTEP